MGETDEPADPATTGLQDSLSHLHGQLRSSLRSAGGRSCEVVALFADIRGFSSFSERNESLAIAKYLRAAVTGILDRYFHDATFFKLTGDGLLVVYEHPDSEQALRSTLASVLKRAIKLVYEFNSIAADDVMVTIRDLPTALGIGVARGPATCLIAKDGAILDYTGRCLNLAARAMDKARPLGVVFADTHAADLIDDELALVLSDDEVCIRGIAERVPIPIQVTAQVKIRPADRVPTEEDDDWGESHMMSVEEVRSTSGHAFYLPRPPQSDEVGRVWIEYPFVDSAGKVSKKHRWYETRGRLERHPQGTVVVISFDEIKRLTASVPDKNESWFLGIRTKNYITFRPFVRAKKR
jgi:class 3 adenylate cyclase